MTFLFIGIVIFGFVVAFLQDLSRGLDERPLPPRTFFPTEEEKRRRQKYQEKIDKPDWIMDRFNAFMFKRLGSLPPR